MIDSDYYLTYRGPNMTSCILDGHDYTDTAINFYGELNNWNGKLHTYKEFFGENSKGKKFRFDFKGSDGRAHWFHGWIEDENQFINIPLATPITQITTSV
tara:strand:+ start:609 stop:908 length:300 start_codon:yes stop_codon:yes gene_type:complete